MSQNLRTFVISVTGGKFIAKETLEPKDNGINVEVIIPYDGTNTLHQGYYTQGRTFWTKLEDNSYSQYLEITRDSHPEYFLWE